MKSAQEVEQAVARYGSALLRLAAHYLSSRTEAEDVVQEALLKWLQREKPFESGEQEKAWLYRVTANLCKDRLRPAWFRRTGPLEEDRAAEASDAWEVWEQVRALPPPYRTVLYLYYYEGYAVREIAAILRKNPHTVQTWLGRARKKLRLELEEGG